MNFLSVIPILLVIFIPVAWVTNLVKLTDCDFVAPYKCEIIHGVGLIPPAAAITVWFNTDKENP